VLAPILNLVLPGCGLVLRDRVIAGLVLLVAALALLAVAVLAPLAATPAFAGRVVVVAGAGYLVLAALAGGLWWWWEREHHVDRSAVLRRHRAAATAWLGGDPARARSEAEALARQAPGLPGAWQLLAMICRSAGDAAAADRAERRGRDLRRRLDERGATAGAVP